MRGRKKGIVLGIILIIFGSFLFRSQISAADQYPIKPIVYIIPLEAGSDGDILARPILQKVSALLGQPIMVVNKPGAGASIGYREIHDAKPDGYTIGGGFATIVTNKLQGILPYDHEAFTVMGTYAVYVPIIVASTKTQRPFKTMEEVIAFGKSHPGEVSMATSGVGQSWWIATMLLQSVTGVKFNLVPQPGVGALTLIQVAGGHTDLGIVGLGIAKPQVDAGNIRILAIGSPKRAPAPYDTIPTLRDLGYDFRFESPQVVIGPPKIPKHITHKLSKAFETVAIDPEFQTFAIDKHAFPYVTSLDETVQFLNSQRKVYRSIMEEAGILKEKK